MTKSLASLQLVAVAARLLLNSSASQCVRHVACSQSWLVTAARVPEREDVQVLALGLVVHEVANSAQEESPHTGGASSFVLGADLRLLGEQ